MNIENAVISVIKVIKLLKLPIFLIGIFILVNLIFCHQFHFSVIKVISLFW